MKDFITWLDDQLAVKGWTRAELSRRAKISPSAISMIASEQRKPGVDICESIARALDYPPETVYRLAGLLPPIPPDQERVENWREILRLLTPEEEAELREIGLLKISRREAAARLHQRKQQPPLDND